MAWYQTPIRPLDPVIPDDQVTQAIRYIRDSFQGTGQDSFTSPPSQNKAQWQQLLNVMPITRGSIERRRGYNTFASLSGHSAPLFMTDFQSDTSNQRNILVQSPTKISAFNEDGTSFNTSLFTLATPPVTGRVRSLTSRSYQYFYDGVRADMNKWDGSAVGFGPPNTTNGVSNWGIDSADVTTTISGGGSGTTTFGPLGPGTASSSGSGSVWTNPNNIKVDDALSAATGNTGAGYTQKLLGTNFGLAATGSSVVGITIKIKADGNNAPVFGTPTMYAQLLKAGVPYGTVKNLPLNGSGTYTFGGATDLWGGSWSVSDINDVNFGVQIYGSLHGTPDDPADMTVQFVSATVVAKPGAASSSGNGVGIDTTVAGNVNLTVGRTYYLAPFNSISGQYGDISAASPSTGPVTNKKFNLLLAVYNDPQVDRKVVLATADGNDPSILYQVAEVTNATTTFQDNTLETDLVVSQVLLFTDNFGNEFGLSLNDPPPLGNLAIKHKGRLWIAQGQNLFFSKSVAELTLPNGYIAGRYEESWPGDNYFDISQGAETITGLLSDGQTLYIGTQAHIRRLLGDDPSNFQEPEIVHPEVGLLNQDVWQVVFMQGVPAGSIWVTPDLRVIQSDFMQYQDIGHPVQDILNSANASAASLAYAQFVADGEFDLLLLAIPVNSTTFCDTLLVFDMRAHQWCVWQLATGVTSLFFNITAAGVPQWLFTDNDLVHVHQLTSTSTTDNGTAIAYNATTAWLDFGEPTKRKLVDEIEITGDGNMVVSVYGASSQADFNSPKLIYSGKPKVSPFGQFKIYLAAQSTKYRYYQIKFAPTTDIGLEGYNIRVVPFFSL